MLISNKTSVIYLLNLFKQLEINEIVICPGSRNLPLTISFTSDNFFNCTSVLDERTAGFFALGKVKASQKPVAVITTSGSAGINLGSAMSEAYYQHLPLIAITADRPSEWIKKGENQTIIQKNIFQNYIGLEIEIKENIELNEFEDLIPVLYNVLFDLQNRSNLHINIPFSEPLLEVKNMIGNFNFSIPLPKKSIPESFDWSQIKNKNILLYISSNDLSEFDKKTVNELINSFNLILIADINSNFSHSKMIKNIDYILENTESLPKPDILMSFGEQMLSKKLRKQAKSWNLQHIDISEKKRNWDLLSIDYHCVSINLSQVLVELKKIGFSNSPEFSDQWQEANKRSEDHHINYFSDSHFSEFSIVNSIMENLEDNSSIYWGNSSPIRYANWSYTFSNKTHHHLANRGVSGIDGVLTSAIGYQTMLGNKEIYCVLGDLSLYYELGALLALQPNSVIKIIVLNNHGGQIFQNIHDISMFKSQSHILTPQNPKIENIAYLYDLDYLKASDFHSFQIQLNELKQNDASCILEIDFQGNESNDWRSYFSQILTK